MIDKQTQDYINSLPAFRPGIDDGIDHSMRIAIFNILAQALNSFLNPLTLTFLGLCYVLGYKKSPWFSPAIAAVFYVLIFLELDFETRGKLGLGAISMFPQFLFVHSAVGYGIFIAIEKLNRARR